MSASDQILPDAMDGICTAADLQAGRRAVRHVQGLPAVHTLSSSDKNDSAGPAAG